jgi:hypothetical protein
MAATNSNSSDEPQTFKPFSWLSEDAQHLPLASFAAKTFDIAQGIGLIMEMIEDTQLCEEEEDRRPMLSGGQCGVLQRMVIATADALQSEARHAMNWLDEYGVKYYAPNPCASHDGHRVQTTPQRYACGALLAHREGLRGSSNRETGRTTRTMGTQLGRARGVSIEQARKEEVGMPLFADNHAAALFWQRIAQGDLSDDVQELLPHVATEILHAVQHAEYDRPGERAEATLKAVGFYGRFETYPGLKNLATKLMPEEPAANLAKIADLLTNIPTPSDANGFRKIEKSIRQARKRNR